MECFSEIDDQGTVKSRIGLKLIALRGLKNLGCDIHAKMIVI